MHRFFGTLILLGAASMAQAAHNGGSDGNSRPLDTASCNASFQSGCASSTTLASTNVPSSGGFAAPAGEIGSSAAETIVLGAVSLTAWARWRARRRLATGPGQAPVSV